MLQERWFALHGRGGGLLLHSGASANARYTYDLAGPVTRPAVGAVVPLLPAASDLAGAGAVVPGRKALTAKIAALDGPVESAASGDTWHADDPYLAHLQRHRNVRHGWIDNSRNLGIPV